MTQNDASTLILTDKITLLDFFEKLSLGLFQQKLA